LAASVLPVLGLGFFMIFQYLTIGDGLAFLNIQKYWEKPVLGLNPIFAIPFSFIDFRLEGSLKIHLYNLFWVIFVTGTALWTYKKKLLPKFLQFISLWLFVPLTAGTMLAVSRYASIIAPLFISSGKISEKWPKLLLVILLIMLASSQLVLLYFGVKGFWIAV
jgi:hypothetical protein